MKGSSNNIPLQDPYQERYKALNLSGLGDGYREFKDGRRFNAEYEEYVCQEPRGKWRPMEQKEIVGEHSVGRD